MIALLFEHQIQFIWKAWCKDDVNSKWIGNDQGMSRLCVWMKKKCVGKQSCSNIFGENRKLWSPVLNTVLNKDSGPNIKAERKEGEARFHLEVGTCWQKKTQIATESRYLWTGQRYRHESANKPTILSIHQQVLMNLNHVEMNLFLFTFFIHWEMSDDDGRGVGRSDDRDIGGRGVAAGHRHRVSWGHNGAGRYFLGVPFISIGRRRRRRRALGGNVDHRVRVDFGSGLGIPYWWEKTDTLCIIPVYYLKVAVVLLNPRSYLVHQRPLEVEAALYLHRPKPVPRQEVEGSHRAGRQDRSAVAAAGDRPLRSPKPDRRNPGQEGTREGVRLRGLRRQIQNAHLLLPRPALKTTTRAKWDERDRSALQSCNTLFKCNLIH